MFDQPRYIQDSFGITFLEHRSVVSLERQIYGKLRDFYFPVKLPSPNPAAPDAARLLFQSQHGNSQIVIGDSNATLTVAYSLDWQVDPAAAQGYMRERAGLLLEVLRVLGEREPLFCGTVMHVRLPSKSDDASILRLLSREFAPNPEPIQLFDVQSRATSILDEKFYSNITVQNYRVWSLSLGAPSILRLSQKAASERGVEVISDLNSRYGFNEDRALKITRETVPEMLGANFAIVQGVIDRVNRAANGHRV